jgi:hypothetical protein
MKWALEIMSRPKPNGRTASWWSYPKVLGTPSRPNMDLRQAICSANSAKESGAPIFLRVKQTEAALRQNQTLFENLMDPTSSAQRS